MENVLVMVCSCCMPVFEHWSEADHNALYRKSETARKATSATIIVVSKCNGTSTLFFDRCDVMTRRSRNGKSALATGSVSSKTTLMPLLV